MAKKEERTYTARSVGAVYKLRNIKTGNYMREIAYRWNRGRTAPEETVIESKLGRSFSSISALKSHLRTHRNIYGNNWVVDKLLLRPTATLELRELD